MIFNADKPSRRARLLWTAGAVAICFLVAAMLGDWRAGVEMAAVIVAVVLLDALVSFALARRRQHRST